MNYEKIISKRGGWTYGINFWIDDERHDTVNYFNGERYRTAKLSLYDWARHLHGNALSGTPYAYFNAILPTGERCRVKLCV